MTNPAEELMTLSQLSELRSRYAAINTVDPEGLAYVKLIALLDASSQPRLKQLASAGIKFVSALARNRVKNA